MLQDKNRMVATGRLQDLVAQLDPESDPFLYYLPHFLNTQLQSLNSTSAVLFTEKALSREQTPLVADALKILNQLVRRDDRSLIAPRSSMFEGNRHFFWKELGNHHDALSVITHLISKVTLVLSLERG